MTLDDLLAFAGVLVLALGVAVIYWPAALILIGLAMAAAGVLRAR